MVEAFARLILSVQLSNWCLDQRSGQKVSSIDPLTEVRMPLRLTRYNANIDPDREKENHPFHGNPIVKFPFYSVPYST